MPEGRYPREVLEREAARSTSLVELMSRVGAPMGRTAMRYLEGRLRLYTIDTGHFRDEALPHRRPRSYGKEILAEAAARSYSIREVVAYLGEDNGDIPYSHIRGKLERFGIDTSHFRSRRTKHSGRPGRTELASAVATASGIAETLRILGRPVTSSQRKMVGKCVEEYGLPTHHFLGQAHSRGRRSGRRATASAVLVRKEPDAGRTSAARLRRALDEIGRDRVCARCGTGEEWNGVRLVLEIDHINGDWRDNRRENLRYLCPCCHSQTQTYAGRGSRRQ